MKRLSLVVLAATLLGALGLTPPARAQGVFFEVDFGRAAVAIWEDHRTETFAFAVAGQGMIFNSDIGEPLLGNVGCAAVGKGERGAFGCGELSAFEMANDLGSAKGKGTFDATIFDFSSGKMTKKGKISFEASWTATGDAGPRGFGGLGFDQHGGGFFVEAQIARDATNKKLKGRVKGPIGRAPSQLIEAFILFGPTIGFEFGGPEG